MSTHARCAYARREFLARVPAFSLGMGALLSGSAGGAFGDLLKPRGAKPTVDVRAAVIRRREYGLSWPGGAYDGEAAERRYTRELRDAAGELGINLMLNAGPIHDDQASGEFLARLQAEPPDGVVLLLLDRHGPAWPTANKVADTDIPTVIFCPVGAAFTSNVIGPSRKPGTFIVSSVDFGRVRYGLQMIRAWRAMQESRLIVLRGDRGAESRMEHLGTTLITLPAEEFAKAFNGVPADARVNRLTDECRRVARKAVEPSRKDVQDGVRCYFAAKEILEAEDGDAITMDCLGLIRRGRIPAPCLGWCLMNDEGTTAVCEADLKAAMSMMLVRYLFDKPGFMQDPVPETVRNGLIGSHCTCATRLRGYDQPPEPIVLRSHHGGYGCAPQVLWQPGERMTICQFTGPKQMLIYSGTVLENMVGPDVGGCRTAPMVSVDGVEDVTAVKGFHQVFFYGEHARDLKAFCHLYGIEAAS